jgi:hypothetical protein
MAAIFHKIIRMLFRCSVARPGLLTISIIGVGQGLNQQTLQGFPASSGAATRSFQSQGNRKNKNP